MFGKIISREDHLFLQHIGILLSGFILGMIATYIITLLPLDFSKNLEDARKLGIVSLTTLNGYPKARDTFNFLMTVTIPVLFAVGGWLVFIRGEKRRIVSEILNQNYALQSKTKAWPLCLVFITVVYVVLSYNINVLYKPNRFSEVYWPFLGEEGLTLAFAQSLLSGGMFSRDFISGYGPMLIYPLVLFMKLFGTTVMTQRIYAYFLNMIAYAIVIAFTYKTMRSKTFFVSAAIMYLLIFPPLLFVSPNATHLRVALGFLPLLLAYINFERKNTGLLWLAGIVAGQCLLFSQEVGICSVISLLIFILLQNISQSGMRSFFRDAIIIAAGGMVSVAPFLLYFSANGVLGTFLGEMFIVPRLYALGYSANPFPDFRAFIANPFREDLYIHYWVLLTYIIVSITLIPLLIMRKFSLRNILKCSLLVFGIFLFRGALCRSDEGHVFFASQPAFMLFFLFLDDAFVRFFEVKHILVKWANLLLVAVLISSFGLMFKFSSDIKNLRYPSFMSYGLNMSANQQMSEFMHPLPKWSIKATGFQTQTIDRAGGIYFSRDFSQTLMKIDAFLKAETKRGDYVYFFPNEAAYYFLFDRLNPTRYAFAYAAVTSDHRLELIRDLEAKKPVFVVYSFSTWRIDGIPETVQVPEVVQYLKNNYRVTVNYGDVIILKRIGM